MYATESSPVLRVEIVKAFALLTHEQAAAIQGESTAMLTAALKDQEPQVVAFAALGVGRQRLTSLLPEVVPLLSHKAQNVRLLVSQGIAAFGPEAAKYVPQVEAAIAVERDDIVRKTLEGTLSVIGAR
jgi:HEAT repeat protein